MRVALARSMTLARLAPSVLGSSQIHMPWPANWAGSAPTGAAANGAAVLRTIFSLSWLERRPARSRTLTLIVPLGTPAGTRATQPEELARRRVAIAPRLQ